MPEHDGPDEPAADTNAKPFIERRRPGRAEYTNPHLIALLLGKLARELATREAPQDVRTEPDRGIADDAGSPGAPGWPIALLALAIASWVVVGVLVWLTWLVIRLL
jgi:hypothetical protein